MAQILPKTLSTGLPCRSMERRHPQRFSYSTLPSTVPLLQSRQFIITNDGRIFIDHRSIFGNGAGPHLLTSWSSTLAWFLRHVLPPVHIPSIGDILHPIFIYMDDFYSICFQLESEFLNDAPPRAMILADQALRPLGIIMEPKKYEHGEFVVVTGFGVNSHDVSLSLSPNQKTLRSLKRQWSRLTNRAHRLLHSEMLLLLQAARPARRKFLA